MAGWTVQTLIDSPNPKCRHHSGLDLEALKTQLGPDAPAMADDLEPKLRCSKCRGKAIGLIYSPTGNEKLGSGGSHNRG